MHGARVEWEGALRAMGEGEGGWGFSTRLGVRSGLSRGWKVRAIEEESGQEREGKRPRHEVGWGTGGERGGAKTGQ